MFHSTGRQTVYTGIYIHIVLLIFVEPFDNAVSDGGGIIVHIIIVELYVFFVADKAHLDDQTCHICLFDNDVIVVTVKLCSGTDTTVIGDSDLLHHRPQGWLRSSCGAPDRDLRCSHLQSQHDLRKKR